MNDFDVETWIVEAGARVIEKKAEYGEESLTPLERLTYCLWVADYGMRNAGDLETAEDLHAGFQQEAAAVAAGLGLPLCRSAFELPTVELERRYFDLVALIVGELWDSREPTIV